MLTLEAKVRQKGDKAQKGTLKAVYYGAKTASTPVFIDAISFDKILRQAGESTAITLKVGSEEETALIHEVMRDPVKNTPTHVDFYVVEKGQKVHVNIPLTFTGDSEAVKQGGVLVKVMHELPVEASATNLPHELTVDLSALVAKDSVITVADIKLPQGVSLYHIEASDVVASITEAKEEEETPVAAPDLSTIEVEKKGKKEEEGEEAAE